MSGRTDSAMERTQQATPRKQAEARQRGQVARSADLSAGVVLLGGGVAVSLLGPGIFDGLVRLTGALLDGRANPLAGPGGLGREAMEAAAGLVWPVAGLVGSLVCVAVAAGLVQVGGLVTAEPLRPSWERLSPWANAARLGLVRSAVRAGLAGAKLVCVAVVTAWVLRSNWGAILRGQAGPGTLLTELMIGIGAGLVAVGLADWAYQRWQWKRDLMMTSAEWREELRRTEGDPALRGRRRTLARRWRSERNGSSA